MIVFDTINNKRKHIQIPETIIENIPELKIKIWESFDKNYKYLPIFLVLQEIGPTVTFYSFIDFGLKKIVPYYKSTNQNISSVLLDSNQDPHKRAVKLLNISSKEADEIMKILVYLSEPDMFSVFKNDMDSFILKNTPGKNQDSPQKTMQKLPMRLPMKLPPRINTVPKVSPTKPKTPPRVSPQKPKTPPRVSPQKPKTPPRVSPTKPKTPPRVSPLRPKPSNIIIPPKAPEFSFTKLNLKFVLDKANIPEDVLLNDLSLDSTIIAVKSGEKNKVYGENNDTVNYFLTRKLRGEDKCVLLYDTDLSLYYFWDFKNKNAIMIDSQLERIYKTIDPVIISYEKTINYFIEKVNKHIREEMQIQYVSEPKFVLTCQVIIPKELFFVFTQKQKYSYIANKMGFTAVVNKNNVLKISYKAYDAYLLLKRDTVDLNKVVSLVQLDWWLKNLQKILTTKEQARDRLGDIIEDMPISEKKTTRLSEMKKAGIPVNSRMCQKERQPVIISNESEMRGNYTIKYKDVLFDCPDSPYKNPGFIKDVPCCFITDQREEQRVYTTNEKYNGKFIAKKGDNWYLIDNKIKQLVAIRDLPTIDDIDQKNPVLLGPIPLSKIFDYSSDADCRVRPESLEDELCPPDTTFGYVKKGTPCCFRLQKKQTATKQSYIIKTGKNLKTGQLGEVPPPILHLIKQPIYRMGIKPVEIPFIGHIAEILNRKTLLQDMASFYKQNPNEYNKVMIDGYGVETIIDMLINQSHGLKNIPLMSMARLIALFINKNIVLIEITSDYRVHYLTGLDVYSDTIILLKNAGEYEVIVKKPYEEIETIFAKDQSQELYKLYEPEAYSLDSVLRSGLIKLDSQMINCFGYTEYLVTDMKLILPIKPSKPSLRAKEIPFTVYNHEPQIRYLNSFGHGWQVKGIVKNKGLTVALMSENGLVTPVVETRDTIDYPSVPGAIASNLCKPPELEKDALLKNMKNILVFVNKNRFLLSRYFSESKDRQRLAQEILANGALTKQQKASSIKNILKDYYNSSGIPDELMKMFINEIVTDIRKKRIITGKVEKDDIKINNKILRPDEFTVLH